MDSKIEQRLIMLAREVTILKETIINILNEYRKVYNMIETQLFYLEKDPTQIKDNIVDKCKINYGITNDQGGIDIPLSEIKKALTFILNKTTVESKFYMDLFDSVNLFIKYLLENRDLSILLVSKNNEPINIICDYFFTKDKNLQLLNTELKKVDFSLDKCLDFLPDELPNNEETIIPDSLFSEKK